MYGSGAQAKSSGWTEPDFCPVQEVQSSCPAQSGRSLHRTGDAFQDSLVTSLEMLVILWINTKIILYITSTPSCTSFSAMIHFKSWDEFSLDEKIFGSWEYKKIYQWGFLSIPGVYVDFFVGVSSIHSHQSRHRRRRRESLVSLMNNFELFILQRFFLHLGSVP